MQNLSELYRITLFVLQSKFGTFFITLRQFGFKVVQIAQIYGNESH
jgi:hypothetical protein